MNLNLWLFILCLLYGPLNHAQDFPGIAECPVREGTKRDHFIILHGLNLKPSKMNDLATLLRKSGFETSIITFKGHGKNYRDFQTATAKEWLQQIRTTYCRVKNQNNNVYLMAFSLGTAYGLLFQHFYPMKIPFKKIILFAPAIKGRWYTNLTKPLGWWKTLSLPSKSLTEYRAHSHTPINGYNNAHAAMEILNRSHLRKSQVDTLIFLEPEDELIHYQDTLDLITEKKLDRWKVVTITRKKLPLRGQFHHMMIDKKSLGPSQWKRVSDKIFDFLIEDSSD